MPNLTPPAPLTPLLFMPSNGKQRLAEFDGLAVGDEAFDDFAGGVGLDFVHQLHGFDNADDLAFFDVIAGGDEGRGTGRRRAVIGSDDRRFDDMQFASVRRPARRRAARPARRRRRQRWGAAATGGPDRKLPRKPPAGLNLSRIFRSPRSRSNSATWYSFRNSISSFRSCDILWFHSFLNSPTLPWDAVRFKAR